MPAAGAETAGAALAGGTAAAMGSASGAVAWVGADAEGARERGSSAPRRVRLPLMACAMVAASSLARPWASCTRKNTYLVSQTWRQRDAAGALKVSPHH